MGDNLQQSKEIVKALINLNKPVTYCELNAEYGHDSFLIENDQLKELVKNFLGKLEYGQEEFLSGYRALRDYVIVNDCDDLEDRIQQILDNPLNDSQ